MTNSVIAWITPGDFRDLLTSNSLTSHIGHADLMVKLIGINDAALFLVIFSGQYRKLVAVWGSAWLVAVIYVTGFWITDSIEHLSVLALLIYYNRLKD